MVLVGPLRRRQPQGLLGELGRDLRRTAIGSQARGVVEDGGDLGVRLLPRQREMAGTEERILDDVREASVNGPPLVPQIAVEDRRQQRVGEADRPVLALDHLRGERRLERVGCNARLAQNGLGGGAQCRGEREGPAGWRGEPGDPRAHELLERLRNRQRLSGVDVPIQHSGELQGEERVAARSLVELEQRLAREWPAEPVEEQPMQRADAQRRDRETPDSLRAECRLDARARRRVADPLGGQHEHGACREPADRECERVRRRGVEPLEVVDRDQQRHVLGEQLQRATGRDRERARVDRIIGRLL
jgi:hypothetical protein